MVVEIHKSRTHFELMKQVHTNKTAFNLKLNAIILFNMCVSFWKASEVVHDVVGLLVSFSVDGVQM